MKIKLYKKLYKELDEKKPGIGTGNNILDAIEAEVENAKLELNTAKMLGDESLVEYWKDYWKYLNNYLNEMSFDNVKKLANSPEIERGDVKAAQFLLSLY